VKMPALWGSLLPLNDLHADVRMSFEEPPPPPPLSPPHDGRRLQRSWLDSRLGSRLDSLVVLLVAVVTVVAVVMVIVVIEW